MTSQRIDSTVPPAGNHESGTGPRWYRVLKYTGICLLVLSVVPYLVLATWVNIFSPELISENDAFGTTVDPVSSSIGGWAFLIGFPVGLALVLAGWIVNGHLKDRRRYGRGKRLGYGVLRLAASLGAAVLTGMLAPMFQLLLTVVVGRN
ncbi:hypothetical protein [Arthrobacter sp. H14]|uniref:hypothetical protein n=1 Tax=Arthrobacter sp. H14 TaxID=1312959 RepID=UPI00047B4C04|nr:hypothetical protein [Arthrobacter sp. H14]